MERNPDHEFTLHEQIDLVDMLIERYGDDRVGLLMLDALRCSIVATQRELVAQYHRDRDERERLADIEQRFLAEMRAANEQLVELATQIGVTL